MTNIISYILVYSFFSDSIKAGKTRASSLSGGAGTPIRPNRSRASMKPSEHQGVGRPRRRVKRASSGGPGWSRVVTGSPRCYAGTPRRKKWFNCSKMAWQKRSFLFTQQVVGTVETSGWDKESSGWDMHESLHRGSKEFSFHFFCQSISEINARRWVCHRRFHHSRLWHLPGVRAPAAQRPSCTGAKEAPQGQGVEAKRNGLARRWGWAVQAKPCHLYENTAETILAAESPRKKYHARIEQHMLDSLRRHTNKLCVMIKMTELISSNTTGPYC